MYFAPLMIDIKQRFGHILKERGLVMRGKEYDGDLSLKFQIDHDKRKLTVSLDVQGKADTGAEAARWEHTSLSAQIHEEVKLGDTGYYCYLYREDHTVDPTDFDTEEDFVAEVGAYLQECVIVNFAVDDFAVHDEIALAYLALVDLLEPEPPQFSIERKGKSEHLTATDAEGKVLTFAISPGKALEISVNGEIVNKLNQTSRWHIEEVLADHFTTAFNLRHR
ncbi:hypothetical protein [Agrobacterium tumefaciens]|uniref:hypothetical protein n=1 Tax=Agrobacterium tumefaciens TaxID=358 RepID=UPI003B9F014E